MRLGPRRRRNGGAYAFTASKPGHRLGEEYADVEDMPDEIDQRVIEIETVLGTLEDRPVAVGPDPSQLSVAG